MFAFRTAIQKSLPNKLLQRMCSYLVVMRRGRIRSLLGVNVAARQVAAPGTRLMCLI
jgi:hypothetical protein